MMRWLRQFVAASLLFAPLGPAVMACALPGAQMSKSEMTCCKKMSHKCADMHGMQSMDGAMQSGDAAMQAVDNNSAKPENAGARSAGDTCCQTVVRAADLFISGANQAVNHDCASSALSVRSAAGIGREMAAANRPLFTAAHSPPGNARPNTILRI